MADRSPPSPDPLPTAAASGDDAAAARPPVDPLGVFAVGAGFVGIVLFGILMALLAALLGAVAGQRARDAGRSMELAYLALILSAVDGVVWLAMQALFEVPIWIG